MNSFTVPDRPTADMPEGVYNIVDAAGRYRATYHVDVTRRGRRRAYLVLCYGDRPPVVEAFPSLADSLSACSWISEGSGGPVRVSADAAAAGGPGTYAAPDPAPVGAVGWSCGRVSAKVGPGGAVLWGWVESWGREVSLPVAVVRWFSGGPPMTLPAWALRAEAHAENCPHEIERRRVEERADLARELCAMADEGIL